MTPPPGLLRWTTLLATAVVVVGGAAGYVLWHRLVTENAALPAPPTGTAGAAGAIRRLEPPTGAAPDEVERIRGLVADCMDGATAGIRDPAEAALEDAGETAVPYVLDAAARLALEGEGFADLHAFPRLHRLDRVLSSIRRTLTPADPPPPWRSVPDAAWARARVAHWFAWWDARR